MVGLWQLVRGLASAAGIDGWDQLSAHSLRHTGVKCLDAGVPLRDVQDCPATATPAPPAATTIPATAWTGSAAYAVAAYLS
jgi:integrase